VPTQAPNLHALVEDELATFLASVAVPVAVMILAVRDEILLVQPFRLQNLPTAFHVAHQVGGVPHLAKRLHHLITSNQLLASSALVAKQGKVMFLAVRLRW
jgi:hypothetical protein